MFLKQLVMCYMIRLVRVIKKSPASKYFISKELFKRGKINTFTTSFNKPTCI